MSTDLEALRQANWERNSYLACAVVIVLEYVCQFDYEVELFWKKKWNAGKILFLWSRYYSICFNIGNAVVFMQQRPSYEFCNQFFHWQDTGAALQTLTNHIILMVRLYAMYGSSKEILALLIALILSEATVMGVMFGYPEQSLVGTNEPFTNVFICADGDPLSHNHHWVVYYWAAILIIETILLSLSLWKAWILHSTGRGGSLMGSLTRGSVWYFAVIFWIYLANMILWIINRLTLDELGTAYSFVISNILANRLLLSVRVTYYLSEEDTSLPMSVHFRQKKSTNYLSRMVEVTDEMPTLEEMELSTFDDRRGF